MPVVFQIAAVITAIWAIVTGSILMYRFFKTPKYGEGLTLQKLNKLLDDNEIMKKALLDIVCISHFDDFFNIPDDAEICDYVHVISVLKRDAESIQSKACMALDAIFDENMVINTESDLENIPDSYSTAVEDK